MTIHPTDLVSAPHAPEADPPRLATTTEAVEIAALTRLHKRVLATRLHDAEAGWRREAAGRLAAEKELRAVAAPCLPAEPARAVFDALRPIEDPLSHADWHLTVLELAFGHNHYLANGEVDPEWTALGALIIEALLHVRDAREEFSKAWDTAHRMREATAPAASAS